MTTKKPPRGPSVQVTEHSTFALELTAYLNESLGSMSGREFARKVAVGGKSHWAQILAGAKVMTTNDIKVAADFEANLPCGTPRSTRWRSSTAATANSTRSNAKARPSRDP